MRIRPAEPQDIPALTALLLRDARKREGLDANLWAVAPDAPARIAASLQTLSAPWTGPIRHHWLVAERGGVVVATTHGANLPAPPIIDLRGGTAGVLLDDCHFTADREASGALLAATERALVEAGAVILVAASPAGWASRTAFLEAAGYEPTTLYLAKTGLGSDAPMEKVRKAADGDLDGIVRLSARHRAELQIANPIFWAIDADADAGFAAWMRVSLGLPDRSIFVFGPPDAIQGYIIAQPGSPLHLAPAHDAARIGLIDDFYATAFEPAARGARDRDGPGALLGAAENDFRARGIETALAICPVRMTAKADALRGQGYEVANLWMVKPG